MSKLRVLFLCTGNSCRSQMAEAIVNEHLGEGWEAFSVGSHPANNVHPLAIQVLSDIGIEHQGKPKSISRFIGQSFDQVVTLCDDSDDSCPVWLGKGKQVRCPFPDPVVVSGNEDQMLQAFCQVRDAIAERVVLLLTAE